MQMKTLLAFVLIFGLIGCATTKQETGDTELYKLQTRVKQLELQLEQKDEEISDLENQLEEVQEAKEVKVYSTDTQSQEEYVSKPDAKQIQAALKNAGFYDGAIDGKIGDKTRSAIKEFQKANGLVADGVVGDKTWAKLGKYL